jgi:hypothetical protein
MPVLIPSGRRARSKRLPTFGPSGETAKPRVQTARPTAGGKAIVQIGAPRMKRRVLKGLLGPRLMVRHPRLPH